MTARVGAVDAAADGPPDGAVLRLRHDTRVSDGGRSLTGGAPTRVLYLTAAAQGLLRGRELRVRDARSRALGARLLEAGLADPVLSSLPRLRPARPTSPSSSRPSDVRMGSTGCSAASRPGTP